MIDEKNQSKGLSHGGPAGRVQGKPVYEAPILIPLAELAKGAGFCGNGSGDAGPCAFGTTALSCTPGSGGGPP